MKFVDDEGVSLDELERRARTGTNLPGMQRWGYIVVVPDPPDRPKPRRADWLVRSTPAGRKAQQVWRPLFAEIENRWRERFGPGRVEALRRSLQAVASQLDADLPDCLPILGYGLFSRGPNSHRPASTSREHDDASDLLLPVLLSRVLLAFVIEFEHEYEISLAIAANILRVLHEKEVLVRELPVLSGVSKEAIAVAIGFLQNKGLVLVRQDANRARIARLTPKGLQARDQYRPRLGTIEERWLDRFGKDSTRALRESLETLAGEAEGELSPLFRGLEPYPDGWRASVPKPKTLPHYPMVLHRGGFPDGS